MADELAELRAVVASTQLAGACMTHPERRAFQTCARCGDHACDDCAATMEDGVCPPCVRTRDLALAPRGERIIAGFAVSWLVASLSLGVRIYRADSGSWLWAGCLAVCLVAGAVLVAALQRGSEAARGLIVTLGGVGGVIGLIVGYLSMAVPCFVCAGLLLSRSVSAFLATRPQRFR